MYSSDSNLKITISKQGGMEQKRASELQPLTFLATVTLHEVCARFVFHADKPSSPVSGSNSEMTLFEILQLLSAMATMN